MFLKCEGLAELLGLMVVFLLAPLHRHCLQALCHRGLFRTLTTGKVTSSNPTGGTRIDPTISSIQPCLTDCFFCGFFSSLQICISVNPGLISFFGKVGWIFNDVRVILLFGPDENSMAKAVPYFHIIPTAFYRGSHFSFKLNARLLFIVKLTMFFRNSR
ncbi:hypothetical protein AVEN_87806-1 [Araneus ventricosus]|uniref:Secreted protein n=1 Tax=Araneus ventricosus TaxID=182803 RepID=A0A4Y2BCH6_ARAVE|nr:hypothetical protein AVEN_87806-1 [Araneus ventricosus]